MTIQTGTVKWFDDGKGFVLMCPAEGTKDLFADQSDMRNKGVFRSLGVGAKVEFDV